MAKRQLTDAPDTVLIEALVKMWAAGGEIVPAGAVYPMPAAVANDLAGRGMVRIIGAVEAEAPVEVIEAEVPVDVIEAVEVVAFDLATEGEFG